MSVQKRGSDAFVEAFKAEMDAATHEILVDMYVWANHLDYGVSDELRARAEAWAKEIEKDPDKTMAVLAARREGME